MIPDLRSADDRQAISTYTYTYTYIHLHLKMHLHGIKNGSEIVSD